MRIFFFAASLLLGAVANGRAQEPAAAGPTIRVLDLVPSRGEAVIALFDSPAAFDERSPALRSMVHPVDGETFEWRLEDLPPGEYAAVVYQDMNGNRTLDKGRLGIPKEPYGFSNDARAALGPPSFDQARFIWNGDGATIEIRLTQRPGANRTSPRRPESRDLHMEDSTSEQPPDIDGGKTHGSAHPGAAAHGRSAA